MLFPSPGCQNPGFGASCPLFSGLELRAGEGIVELRAPRPSQGLCRVCPFSPPHTYLLNCAKWPFQPSLPPVMRTPLLRGGLLPLWPPLTKSSIQLNLTPLPMDSNYSPPPPPDGLCSIDLSGSPRTQLNLGQVMDAVCGQQSVCDQVSAQDTLASPGHPPPGVCALVWSPPTLTLSVVT